MDLHGQSLGAGGERRREKGKKSPKNSAARRAGAQAAEGYFALNEYARELPGI